MGTSSSGGASPAKAAVTGDTAFLGAIIREVVSPSFSLGDQADSVAAESRISYCLQHHKVLLRGGLFTVNDTEASPV